MAAKKTAEKKPRAQGLEKIPRRHAAGVRGNTAPAAVHSGGGVPVAHGELAAALGISEETLRAIRRSKLTAREHYATRGEPGDPVLTYTAAGVEKLRELLQLPAVEIRPRDPEPAPSAIGWGTLRVERPMGSPHFVLCRGQDGDQVELKVRSNVHFVRGMEVPPARYRASTVRAGLALLVGKEPRTRGRW